MKSTRIRDECPMLARVEDLEQSRQWAGLTCDIKNLERLSSIDRRRWRKSASNPLENGPRGMRSMQRRSMPEVTKPNLVYVRMTNSENVRSTEKIENREDYTQRDRDRCTIADSEIGQGCNWRPRTEFERNYFGTTENVRTIGGEVNRRCSSIGNEVKMKTRENESSPLRETFTNGSYNGDRSEYRGKSNRTDQQFDRNEENIRTRRIADSNHPAVSRTSGSSFRTVNPRIPDNRQCRREPSSRMNERSSTLAEDHSQLTSPGKDPDDPIAKYKSDKIEVPAHRCLRDNDDAAYRGSRERLHEIFEHNRLLRRQFFAGMPSPDENSDRHNDPNNNDTSRRDTGANDEKPRRGPSQDSSSMTIKDRPELPKNAGTTGFGSTETLTSQSNQSGASSSNGRKSRIEFGNTPEPSEDQKNYEKTVTNDFTRTKRENDDAYSREVRTASFGRDFLPLPSTSSIEYRSNSLDDINELDLYDEDTNSRGRLNGAPYDRTIVDSAPKKSPPIVQYRRTTDFLDTANKCFPTYVNIEDLPESRSRAGSSRMIDVIAARGRKNLPEPLDLTTIDQRWDDRWNTERDILKDYSVEVTPLRDYERSSRGVLTVMGNGDHRCNEKLNASPSETNDRSVLLRGSKSLLELSTNLSRSPPSCLTRKTTNDSSIRRKNVASCLSLANVDDLRSPQLVNDFSNSLNELADRADNNGSKRLSPGHFQDAYDEEDAVGSRSQLSEDSLPRSEEISASATGNGTTLPLVYGPIPYKSPRRYVEGEVTIHYRSPVRHEAKEILSEEELARRSAENMRRVYQEERRRKYLQELHDIDSRRHTDNFVPSQKSPIPLNRYDDFVDDLSYRSRSQEQTPEPRLVARALYNFVGQSSRELTFRRGDLIFVRRQVDKNWYEGEHNAMIGLFPFNYVEILPYDGMRATPKKPYEGQARAKFNFAAQTNLELSLAKGELVVITRRVDENWYEGRIGNRKGIFPVSYVEVLAEPGHRSETPVQSSKPVASPAAHSLLSNGTAGGKMSMGPHHYTPSMPVNTSTTQPHYNSLPRMGGNKLHVAPVNETLHIDTHSETIPYRALYNYRPQNEDELELKEGDTVYVMEKCDDGWYVGSSQRTGYFGTFPGNYVERL